MDSPLEQFDIINLVFLQRSLYEVSFISVIVPFLLLNFFIIMFIFFSKSRYKLIPDV
jgi:hypothetical protein